MQGKNHPPACLPPFAALALVAGLLLAGPAPSARADDYPMPAWSTSLVSSAMCRGSKMHLVATGRVAVAYERVYEVLTRTNILKDVESAYVRELAPGSQTNLVVTPAGKDGFYCFEWKGERANVHDAWRATDTNHFFDGGFVITGDRFFGSFETVMNVRVQRTEDGQAGFRADVLVYPHNGLIRFLFSNLLSVERYFRDVMVDMSAEITRVCTSLCQTHAPPAAAAPTPAAK